AFGLHTHGEYVPVHAWPHASPLGQSAFVAHVEHTLPLHTPLAHSAPSSQLWPSGLAASGTHVVGAARTGVTASPMPHTSPAAHGCSVSQPRHTVFGCKNPFTPENGVGDAPMPQMPLAQSLAVSHG